MDRKTSKFITRNGIVEKECTKCHVFYPLSFFYKKYHGLTGVRSACIECCRIMKHNWYLRNAESQIEKSSNWQKEHRLEKMEYNRIYKIIHRDEIREQRRIKRSSPDEKRKANEYVKNRNKTNINVRIAGNMRRRIWGALKGNRKELGMLGLLGCSIDELKKYLEEKFEPGMSWENYNKYGWCVDHIIPCAAFDLSNPEQQKICFHYTNLQPMWMDDNRRKNDKFIFGEVILSRK